MTPEIDTGISRRKIVVGGGIALAGMAAAVALLDPTQARAAASSASPAPFRAAGIARSAQVVRAGQTLVYPAASTPGCTKETCDFQAQLPALRPAKASGLGVSFLEVLC